MNQLYIERQAAERRRVVLMSQGIANFLDRTSIELSHIETAASAMKNLPGSRLKKAVPQPSNDQTSTTQLPDELASTMDQIRLTFNQRCIYSSPIIRTHIQRCGTYLVNANEEPTGPILWIQYDRSNLLTMPNQLLNPQSHPNTLAFR
jgi:hypothetical protein